MKNIFKAALIASLLMVGRPPRGWAGPGTEGAAFLNIPAGAEPASMGAAYSAFAENAYAPVWNPAGLARLKSPEIGAQHLSYLEALKYEYFGYVQPFKGGNGFGVSAQYLGSPDIAGTDINGNSIEAFDGHYGAYSVGYGHAMTNQLSVGVTGKYIEGQLAGEHAGAFAFDVGTLYRPREKVRLAAVVANMGNKMKFISQSDSLPLAVRIGAAFEVRPDVTVGAEGVHRPAGGDSLHTGIEWRPVGEVSLRAGYRTDTTKGLSPMAGVTLGVGLNLMGQSFSYAWVPMDELGNTQYISALIRFK